MLLRRIDHDREFYTMRQTDNRPPPKQSGTCAEAIFVLTGSSSKKVPRRACDPAHFVKSALTISALAAWPAIVLYPVATLAAFWL